MSEAELHVMAGRLQGAKRAAAERGELRFGLPVGYVYDEDGATIIDPDQEVQAAIADVFAAFLQTGSAYGVLGAFTGRRFPKRPWGGAWAGELRRACAAVGRDAEFGLGGCALATTAATMRSPTCRVVGDLIVTAG